MHNFGLLPIELQASITELRERGIPDAALAVLIERMLGALEAKTTKIQLDVWKIEESLQKRIDTIGDKLASDLRVQHGATNTMLVELLGNQQQTGAAVHELRAEFQSHMESIDAWRLGVEDELASFRASRDESKSDRARHEKRLDLIDHRLGEIERLLEIAANSEARE